jgi:ATP-dependent Clp protease ATP-binding subunit ClpC
MGKLVVVRQRQCNGHDIAKVVSISTGIPVTNLTQEETERLLSLEIELHKGSWVKMTLSAPWPRPYGGEGLGLKTPKGP